MSPDDDKTEDTGAEEPKRRRRRRARKEETPEARPTAGTETSSPEADAAADVPDAEKDDVEAVAADAVPEPVAASEPDAAAEEEPAADEQTEDDSEGADAEAAAGKPRRRRPGRRAAQEDKPAERKPAAPARRRRERPAGPPPVVRAQAKYVRSSPRKARLVCDHIRGKSVEEARAILALAPRAVARDWSKLLESAVANAEHNHELVGEDLYVKAVHADEGPTIKRFRPRAMGRATKIRKRTSHLTILLTPKDD
jgi:ribosomal protein L22